MGALRRTVVAVIALAGCSNSKSPPPSNNKTAEVESEAAKTVKTLCGTCHVPAGSKPPTAAGSNTDPDELQASVMIPAIEELKRLPPAAIVTSLEHGMMRDIGAKLSPELRISIAEYLTGAKYDPQGTSAHYCKPETSNLEADLAGPSWTGWGNDIANTRFQPAEVAKLTADDVAKLKVKWAFAIAPGRAGGTMTVAGDRIFFGDQAGKVRAVNRKTGCTYWVFDAGRWVRTAVHLQKDGARTLACFEVTQFPDAMYCLDAATGTKVWEADLVDHPMSYTSTSAVLHDGVFYVPISVGRESHRSAPDAKYECCTGRGALVAVEATTGKVKWRTFMTPEPQKTKMSEAGTQMWGPSGASAWKAPLVDPVKGRVYVTTGQNSSEPATKTSDAIIAVDMKTGEIAWSYQFTADDINNSACSKPNGAKENCPFLTLGGRDVSTPLLKTLKNGKRLIIVAEKGGRVVAMDPDKDGAIVWDKKPSTGGIWGGVQWGMAADDDNVYVPLHDRLSIKDMKFEVGKMSGGKINPSAGSLVAMRLSDGAEVWRATGPMDSCAGKPDTCSKAYSSPPAVIPGVVFATSQDGHIRAFSTKDGAVLWDFDTSAEFETVNGTKTHGGSIDGPGGVTVVDGTVIVSSGYGAYHTMPGNVMLTFTVDGK